MTAVAKLAVRPRVTVAFLLAAFLLAACGGGTDAVETADTNVVDAGTFRVELPDEIVAVEERTAEPVDAAAGDTDQAAADPEQADPAADDEPTADLVDETPEPTPDPDAIPLAADDDLVGGIFEAFENFEGCLDRLGTLFLGVPDPEIPETTDPKYIEDLTTCAAESGILEATANVQAASASRTLEETEQWNEATLVFIECLRRKGWTVDDPTTDANGSLVVPGVGNNGTLEPPPGEDLLDNPAPRECAAEAQQLLLEQAEAGS